MTPEQALKILEDVTAELSMNRKNHIAVIQALETIKKLVVKSTVEVSNENG